MGYLLCTMGKYVDVCFGIVALNKLLYLCNNATHFKNAQHDIPYNRLFLKEFYFQNFEEHHSLLQKLDSSKLNHVAIS